MQVKKAHVQERILASAEKEFLKHGYNNASLRVIAEQAQLSKGAIYAYYDNKDALFEHLVKPAVTFIENEFDLENFAKRRREAGRSSFQQTIEGFQRCAFDVLDHHTSFRLLLFCAAGSAYAQYKERIIQLYADAFPEMISYFTDQDFASTAYFNDIFLHTIASVYIGYLEEIILHEPERDEIATYAEQMAIFFHAGIKELFLQQGNA